MFVETTCCILTISSHWLQLNISPLFQFSRLLPMFEVPFFALHWSFLLLFVQSIWSPLLCHLSTIVLVYPGLHFLTDADYELRLTSVIRLLCSGTTGPWFFVFILLNTILLCFIDHAGFTHLLWQNTLQHCCCLLWKFCSGFPYLL